MGTTEGLERLGGVGLLSLEKGMLKGILPTGINIQWSVFPIEDKASQMCLGTGQKAKT